MSGPRRRRTTERPRGRRRTGPQRDFWGNEGTESDEPPLIVPAADPTVMLHSLSSPPLPGRETVAVHYFAAVAEKAASLAFALAAASDLLDDEDVGDDADEDFDPEPAER
jgi:hypothetical protein